MKTKIDITPMQKTQDYFLYEVDSLPAGVSDTLPPIASIQKIVVIPPQEHLSRHKGKIRRWLFRMVMTPQRVLVFSPEQIMVLDLFPDGHIDTTAIPVAHLIQIDLTSVLLFGLVGFTWADGTQIQNKAVEFNTVGYRLISKQVNWLRTQMIPRNRPARSKPVPLAGLPQAFPLKFRNYLQLSLFPNECLFTAIYQPSLRLRGCTSGRVLALTDDFFVVVEEESGKQPYGMTLSYCPHRLIQQIEAETTPEAAWLWFTVGFQRQTKKFGFPLSPQNAAALERGFHKVAA